MKLCIHCGEVKPTSEFYRHTGHRDGLKSECKVCTKKRARVNYLSDEVRQKNNHKQWYMRQGRHKNLKNSYGIGNKEYDELAKKQKNACAICYEKTEISLAVDHDHATGKIRELLCRSCNLGVGHFKDDLVRMLLAIKYIAKHKNTTINWEALNGTTSEIT